MNLPVAQILTPELPAGLSIVRGIFREYADILKINLGFWSFEAEPVALPQDGEGLTSRMYSVKKGHCTAAVAWLAARTQARAGDQPLVCVSKVAASLTSNFPGPSMLRLATLPSLTSME